MSVKKNVRIQLFSPEGVIQSDRMVTQLPEFYAGPKEKHTGPIRIEFTFETGDDVLGAMDYLKRLVGALPLKVKGETKQGRKPKEMDNDSHFDEDKKAIMVELIEKYQKEGNQDDFIKELREMGFIFMTTDFLKHVIPESYQIKETHLEKGIDWLIKRTKVAKDPKNDKFDPQIIIGLSMSEGRHERMYLYFYGEFEKSVKIPLPTKKKPITVGKTNIIKFPHYMNEEERFKWGAEHRVLFNTPDKRPSKFYMRWVKDVKVGDELKIDNIEERFNV